ncbi:RagB/SusD family nutrient uptake outer membrane protein [uncultured Cyclobacterium sp.]|uniref:RagB/SusD family nutrient uptake outer membrane protein n=1 Tax=uncultured Cyclobacterium sp. TaxID=453820 RepID=UPI0030ECB564
MKSTIKIFFILTLFSGWSCTDFLDRPPLDQIGIDDYWKSSVDLKNYTARFYESLPYHENNLSTAGREAATTNVTYRTANSILNGETTLSTGSWQSGFAPVRSVNIFLDNYNKCEDPYSSWKQYLGEAQFFKAWIYFDLVQTYGDVPWYTHALTPDDEAELIKPRDSRIVVVDSILSLLDKAIINLEKRDEAPWGNNSINKEAALAFKSRVALFEGTWQKYHGDDEFGTAGADPDKYFQACVDAGNELINGDYNVGIFSTGNPDQDYFDLFKTGDMGAVSEVLLYRAYNIGEFIGHNQNYYNTTTPSELGATWEYVSSHLGSDGEPIDYLSIAQDIKGNDFLEMLASEVDLRLRQSIWIPGDVQHYPSDVVFDYPPIFAGSRENNPTGFQVKKYANPEQELDYANANDAGRIIFRYGEVLLNYAEALEELNGTVAYDQLNLLRERAGMPDFEVLSQDADPNKIEYGYPISDALYEIRRERRVELAFEVLREQDWKRWAAHELFLNKRPKGYPFSSMEFPDESPVVDENGLLDPLQVELSSGYNFIPGRNYLESVPQTELTLNPNLSQNPGW